MRATLLWIRLWEQAVFYYHQLILGIENRIISVQSILILRRSICFGCDIDLRVLMGFAVGYVNKNSEIFKGRFGEKINYGERGCFCLLVLYYF